ncbi:MAG: FkbM family methyltransferase [Clostridia bacterium]|nr:FkbM family methyltransferase [Clostridia bacterium]
MKLISGSDTWTYLKNAGKPLCMYGMGNGADKILKVLEEKGIEIADFFASDGFVRGHTFHSKKVLSYSDLKEKYPDFAVVLAFGSSLSDVLDNFYRIAGERELVAPDVPVCGGELFDGDFFARHESEIDRVYSLLADERSREVFREVIEFKYSGNISHLKSSNAGREDVLGGILSPESYRITADLGAYIGDTARELLLRASGIRRIYALEPDKRSYRKLSAFITDSALTDKVIPVFAAAGENDGEGLFSSEGNRNSGLSDSGKDTVSIRSVDSLARGEKLDMIKYDVEGAEREAILGSREQIAENRPDLIVSVYHRSEDIFSLPLLVHDLCPEYRLYMRREMYVPAWDVELIATVK